MKSSCALDHPHPPDEMNFIFNLFALDKHERKKSVLHVVCLSSTMAVRRRKGDEHRRRSSSVLCFVCRRGNVKEIPWARSGRSEGKLCLDTWKAKQKRPAWMLSRNFQMRFWLQIKLLPVCLSSCQGEEPRKASRLFTRAQLCLYRQWRNS